MKRTVLGIIAVLTLLPAPSTGAQETAIVAIASAETAGGCVTAAGAVAGARSRWLAAWYPNASLMTPAGPCPETSEHVEPPVVCVATEVFRGTTTLFLAARGPDRVTWLYRLVDNGPGPRPDAFAVAAGEETEDRCGAGDLVAAPVRAGSITLIVR